MSIGGPLVAMLAVVAALLSPTSTESMCTYQLKTMYGWDDTETSTYRETFYTVDPDNFIAMMQNGYGYDQGDASSMDNTVYTAGSDETAYLFDIQNGMVNITMSSSGSLELSFVNRTESSSTVTVTITTNDASNTSPVSFSGCTGSSDDSDYPSGSDFSGVTTIHVMFSSDVLTLKNDSDTLFTRTVGMTDKCPEFNLSESYFKVYSADSDTTVNFLTTDGDEAYGELSMASWDLSDTYNFRSSDNVNNYFSDSYSGGYTEPQYFLYVNTSACEDTTDMEWSTATTATDYCSSSEVPDRPDCALPSGATTETECEASGMCCWDSDNSRCAASAIYTCDISGLANSVYNAANYKLYKDGVRQTSSLWSNTLYPGETVQIKCSKSSDPWFSGTAAVDSNDATNMTCYVKQDSNGDYYSSDISTQYNNIACSEKCTTFNYNDTVQSISPAIGDGQRLNTAITVTCNDGYAMSNGNSEWTVDCNNAAAAVDMCYGCSAPTDSSLTTGGTFSASMVGVVATLTYTCNTGYSADGADSQTATCSMNSVDTLAALDTDFEACTADCPLSIDNNNTIITLSSGSRITDNYLPYGYEATVSCAEGLAMAIGQAETLTCSTEGSTITINSCDNYCDVESLLDDNTYSIKISSTKDGTYTSSTADYHVTGTWLQLSCAVGTETSYADESKLNLQCNKTNYDFDSESFYTGIIPDCYDKCGFTSNTDYYFNEETIRNVIVGDPSYEGVDYTSSSFSVATETKVQIFCNDTVNYTVESSNLTYGEYECDTEGNNIMVSPCFKFCSTSDLTMNSNTDTDPMNKVGLLQTVTFMCPNNYYLGSDEGKKFTSTDDDDISCGFVDELKQDDVELSETDVPYTSQCYAGLDDTTPTPDGDGTVLVTVTLPSSRDTSVTITSVKLYDSSGTSLATADISDTSSNTLTMTYTDTSDYSSLSDAYVTIIYDDTPTYNSSSLTLVKGPPSPSVTTESSGVGTVTITISNTAALESYESSTSLSISFSFTATKSSKKRSSDSVTVSGTEYVTGQSEYVVTFSGLSTLSSYDVVMTTTVAVDGTSYDGGSTSFTMDTGFPAPSVNTSVTSSTTNTFTITMGDSLTLSGDYNVTINGTTYELTFTDGEATHVVTGLTELQSYSIDVTMTSSSGVVSDATTVSITQGPTEPVIGDSTFTDTSFGVSWTHVAQNSYELWIYLQGDDGTYSSTYADYYKVDSNETVSTYTFTGLTAGGTYKIVMDAEMEVDGTEIKSDTTELEKTLYSCNKGQKSTYTLYYKTGSTYTEITADYFMEDAATIIYVACQDGDSFVTVDGSYDNTTACIGPAEWATHSDCEVETGAATGDGDSTAIVTGVIIGIIVALIIIIIIIILIKRRKGSPASNAYSPRDEERNQEPEGGEAWKNPYYHENDDKKPGDEVALPMPMPEYNVPKPPPPIAENEYESAEPATPPAPIEEEPLQEDEPPMKEGLSESPDIPDNRETVSTPPPGDNASQGGEMTFDDEAEDPAEANTVIENKNANAV